ncbi:MOSC domain-containing protein [Hahella sp. NBU794]|uniref:MOSC domain-containing protein n=1 Tax=Hahella sp. NBU794 TaxID=3422590 RepID=UPI003D6FDEFF
MAVMVAVSKSDQHVFSKTQTPSITLIAGEGVEGDAHRGVTVKHRSRVKKNPQAPNLRQAHLVHNELLEGLRQQGFQVAPGVIGENITTQGLDLLSLPTGARLTIGEQVEVEITGLRNPCAQLDNCQKGLTAAVLDRDEQGELVRKAGVMAIVLTGGVIKEGDAIAVSLPPEPYLPLAPV